VYVVLPMTSGGLPSTLECSTWREPLNEQWSPCWRVIVGWRGRLCFCRGCYVRLCRGLLCGWSGNRRAGRRLGCVVTVRACRTSSEWHGTSSTQCPRSVRFGARRGGTGPLANVPLYDITSDANACTDAPPRRNRHSRAPSPAQDRERLLERRANRRVPALTTTGPPVQGLASTATSSGLSGAASVTR